MEFSCTVFFYNILDNQYNQQYKNKYLSKYLYNNYTLCVQCGFVISSCCLI